MTIKEVSEKYNIPADTLRYYEKVGVIPPVPRTAGGIRNYTDADMEQLKALSLKDYGNTACFQCFRK